MPSKHYKIAKSACTNANTPQRQFQSTPYYIRQQLLELPFDMLWYFPMLHDLNSGLQKAKKDLYVCMCILKKLFCISIGKSKEGPYTWPGFSVHIMWALFMLGLTLCQDHISISNTYLLLLPNFLLPIRFAEFGLPITMTKVSNICPKTMGLF